MDTLPAFQLPAVQPGKAFTLNIALPDGVAGTIVDVRVVLPDGAVLASKFAFDRKTATLSGTPITPGEYQVQVLYKASSKPKKLDGVLTVLPNPRDRWRTIEPPADALWPSANTCTKTLSTAAETVCIGASQRGRSHAHDGSFRDDSLFMATVPETGWRVLIVADGAGSALYSRRGSAVLCETIGASLQTAILADHLLLDSMLPAVGNDCSPELSLWLRDAFAVAATAGVEAVNREASDAQIPAQTLSSTCLVCVVHEGDSDLFAAGCGVGDGAMVLYAPETALVPLHRQDSGSYAGETVFLDSRSLPVFSDRITCGCLSLPASVFLMTDGVSDPYFDSQNALARIADWDRFCKRLHPIFHHTSPEQALLEWLDDYTPGEHDDRTCVILWKGNKP